ncbi:phage major capsid protein [Ornithinimicrobium sp. LYQ92]|uniref:phage major capsid protein n=1 Tax=Serinicoccus sp. LYQ92 TaxID=3378798 RepID=UPI0038543718
MNLKQQRVAAIKAAQAILSKADAEGRALTAAELSLVEGHKTSIESLTTQIDAVEASQDFFSQIAGPAGTASGKAGVPVSGWADAVLSTLSKEATTRGVKALLDGQVATAPVTPMTALPALPTRVIDLIPKTELDSNHFTYLRQTVRDEQAAPVADNALKPTSIYTFKEIEDRARVVAHLSEPFPLRYLDDHAGLGAILDAEMKEGVLRALEDQIINGLGTGEEFTGLMTTTGVRQVDYGTDVITTIRSARSALGAIGENPTAWVFHPNDLAALDLTREDGATGGFLMDAAAVDNIFGKIPRVESYSVPEGVALLADWRTVVLRVRQAAHTLAATQSGDLFDKNQVKLRAEGRFGLETHRPQAVAVVDLEAA